MRRLFVLLLPVVLFCLFGCPQPSRAQQPNKPPILLLATSDDDVGKNFVYRLRSEIARSGMYRLAEADDALLLEIQVLTLSQETTESGETKNENNLSTSVAVIILLPQVDGNPRFVDAVIVNVGRERTAAMAETVMERIDENAREILRGRVKDQTRTPRGTPQPPQAK